MLGLIEFVCVSETASCQYYLRKRQHNSK
jgi:hypothetical protein